MPAGRVLVLDDDLSVAQTVALVAESIGMEAHCTTGPEEFFRLLDDWVPTHIVLDLVMPQMDGVEVMRHLAQRGCRADIIISSGVGSRVLDAARRSAAEHRLSIVGVLAKPFMPATLRGFLREGLVTSEDPAARPAAGARGRWASSPPRPTCIEPWTRGSSAWSISPS